MEERHRCFVFGLDVTVIDSYCQQDCSIEDCTLNRDNAPCEWKEQKEEGTGLDDQLDFETLHVEK